LKDKKAEPTPLEQGITPRSQTTAVQAKISPEAPQAPEGKRIHERRLAPQVPKGPPVPDENPSPPIRTDREQP